MAIDNRTEQAILDDTTNVAVTEFEFRRGLTDVVEQVNTTQEHMAAARSITLTGDVSGSATALNWNDNTDYDISITVSYGAGSIATADIADSAITTAKIGDNQVTTAKINNGAVTNAKIASSARRRFRILDTNGSTVLFEADGLIPL